MKNTLFLILVVILTTFSCSKNRSEDDDFDSSKAKLIGKWQWLESQGGLTGNGVITPNSSGKTMYLEITNDKIKRFENGIEISNVNYTLENKSSIFSSTSVQVIVYKQNAQMEPRQHKRQKCKNKI